MYSKVLWGCIVFQDNSLHEGDPCDVCDASKDISNQETEFLSKPKKLEIIWTCRFLFVIAYLITYLGSLGNVNFWEEQFHQGAYLQVTYRSLVFWSLSISVKSLYP